eukprot:11195431-Lingulodinium_polyedra.AAC.1
MAMGMSVNWLRKSAAAAENLQALRRTLEGIELAGTAAKFRDFLKSVVSDFAGTRAPDVPQAGEVLQPPQAVAAQPSSEPAVAAALSDASRGRGCYRRCCGRSCLHDAASARSVRVPREAKLL